MPRLLSFLMIVFLVAGMPGRAAADIGATDRETMAMDLQEAVAEDSPAEKKEASQNEAAEDKWMEYFPKGVELDEKIDTPPDHEGAADHEEAEGKKSQ